MEDIGLFNQGWKWVESESDICSKAANGVVHKFEAFVKLHWPNVCYGCGRLGKMLYFLVFQWKDCVFRGFKSFFGLGTVALLIIIWSCFLSLTSMSCLLYVLLCMVSLWIVHSLSILLVVFFISLSSLYVEIAVFSVYIFNELLHI